LSNSNRCHSEPGASPLRNLLSSPPQQLVWEQPLPRVHAAQVFRAATSHKYNSRRTGQTPMATVARSEINSHYPSHHFVAIVKVRILWIG
jgi:hypothetical protein